MKSFNHLFEVAISEEVRAKSVHNVCRGRKNMRNLARYSANQAETVKQSLNWIKYYRNGKHQVVMIHDGISRKRRKIIVPTFEELTVQHCVVQACMPVFMHGMYKHSYASIPGRGSHKAKRYIEKWISEDLDNCRYVLKMDIRHFFDSIPHDIMKRKLAEKIHDRRMLNLLFTIIDVTEVGLPLGFYTSQWLSNWYLEGLDHYIKEELHAKYYVRYMDDMVIFDHDKMKLHEVRRLVDDYLHNELGLELKDNWQVFRFDYINPDDGQHHGRDLDFMGFRFFCDRVTLRRSIMLKATRKANKFGKKEKPTLLDIRQVLSYLGWIKYTDTYNMYLKWIKPSVNYQYCKRRISKCDRRLKDERLNLQSCGGITERTAA